MSSMISILRPRRHDRSRLDAQKPLWIPVIVAAVFMFAVMFAGELTGDVLEPPVEAVVTRELPELDPEWRVSAPAASFDHMYGREASAVRRDWIRNTGALPPSRGGR